MTLEQYITSHTTPESNLLKELVRHTHLYSTHPRMLSGHIQGQFLTMLSCMIRPQKILEIGTFTGYATLCLAKGLTSDGVIHTIERNDELEDTIRSFFDRSEHASQIKLHVGCALEIIPKLNETFDLVFIDGDKREYIDYYNAVFEKVRKGGFILADNVLWDGKVVAEPPPTDLQSKIILKYNDLVSRDTRVNNLLLPLRDGLMIAHKL
jgi:predicted O-methyltransferase YrrM